MSQRTKIPRQARTAGGATRSLRSDRPLVSRLIGLETEYAPLVVDLKPLGRDKLPSGSLVFSQICEAIRRDQPTVAGLFDAQQMFLASGGAVTFEADPSHSAAIGGLVEFATPEVRSPNELLACQRSIDALAAETAADSSIDHDLRLQKNSRDFHGHVYGCQENYEAEVARGMWLWVYRVFIVLMWWMQLVSLLFILPLIIFTLAGTAVYRKLRKLGEPIQDPQQLLDAMPDWFTNALIGTFRLVHLPTILLLRFVAKHVAFRQQQKYLTGFLVSRIALCGSGNLEHDGRYQLSAKAMVIDKLSDIGGFRGERPIFVFGHWLSQFCANSFLSIGSSRQLLRAKQRLQIGLSDSNMSDLAEYVKVGSTSLMLDLIEAGYTKHLPVVKRPLASLRHLASDWNLIARVPTNRGEMSALDLQKAFLKAAESFVASTPAAQRGEAPQVLARWRQLLESVSAFRQDANDTAAAVGRVDWLTKRWMIDRLGRDADWTIRKKIDLRYHELSRDGYFFQLKASRPELELVHADQVQRRRRSPPPCTPAARRGWLIREFANSDATMQSDWSFAIIGNGKQRKRVDFFESSTPE